MIQKHCQRKISHIFATVMIIGGYYIVITQRHKIPLVGYESIHMSGMFTYYRDKYSKNLHDFWLFFLYGYIFYLKKFYIKNIQVRT